MIDRKQIYCFLAETSNEAAEAAKQAGIHHSRTVFIDSAERLEFRTPLTLVVCPGFYSRQDAREMIDSARRLGCQMIPASKIGIGPARYDSPSIEDPETTGYDRRSPYREAKRLQVVN